MNQEKIKEIIKKSWHWPVVIILSACFFVAASSFNYNLQKDGFVKWISPDETGNYTFAKLYAQSGNLQIFEKYNLYVQDMIHPRSMRSDFGNMKPVSFLGLPLVYGTIGKLSGVDILPFLTPFFGALAIIFYYLLIRKIFSRNNALISSFLLASFPVFAYYSARSMFHNVLFVSMLIIGLYFAVLMGEKRKSGIRFDYHGFFAAMFVGLFLGLASITRTSELLWMAPMLFFLWSVNIRNVGLFKLIISIAFFFLAMLPSFYWNQILYSGPANGGYPEMNRSITNIRSAGADIAKSTLQMKLETYKRSAEVLKNSIFFFGFHPKDAVRTFDDYFIKMFPWLFWPACLGFVSLLFSWKRLSKRHFAYIVALGIVSAILVIYYGSWKFNDNPDPSAITIGNSYTRYWLPIYLGFMPFMSLLIIRLTDFRMKNDSEAGRLARYFSRSATAIGRIGAVSAFAFISVIFLLYGSNEGLVETFAKQRSAKSDLDKVLSLTERNSAIITRYHDKLFFPERKVIMGSFDDKNMIKLYSTIAKKLPLYYYNFAFSEADLEYLNARKLGEQGLSIRQVEKVTKEFALYRLSPAIATTTPIKK